MLCIKRKSKRNTIYKIIKIETKPQNTHEIQKIQNTSIRQMAERKQHKI